MAKWVSRHSILLIFISLALIPLVAADTGGYVVESISPDKISGTPQDPSEISFWQLSPRVMAIAIVLSFFPVLVFPLELIFALKVFAALGYRKIEKAAIYYNENRRVIFETLQTNPGICFNELSRLTGINRGTLKYHLTVLQIKGRITTLMITGSVWYFENSGYYSRLEKIMFHYLQEATTRKILEIVFSRPCISQKELAEYLGISEPSVSRHMAVFEREKIINAQKSGRYIRFTLTEDARWIFQKYHTDAVSDVVSATS